MRHLIERLRADFGKRTLGELIQDREAAANAIERLLEARGTARHPRLRQSESKHRHEPVELTDHHAAHPQARGHTLLRMRDVCAIAKVSRATIYNLMRDETFPRPVRLAKRAIRWRLSDVEAWISRGNQRT